MSTSTVPVHQSSRSRYIISNHYIKDTSCITQTHTYTSSISGYAYVFYILFMSINTVDVSP